MKWMLTFFLEHFKETMTVRAMRDKLRQTGAIAENERPKNVPITHILLFKYNVSWKDLINSTQGDNTAEIGEAQRRLEAVQAAFREAEEAAKAAAIATKAAEKSAAEARQREAEAEAAKQELAAALAEVEAQETARNRKTEELTKKSQEGGVVSRGKAASELAQHLAEDPLPLRKAKITLEAATKKAEKARQAAADARDAAERDHQNAIKAQHAAEAALEDANRAVDEAEAYLQEVKSKPGCAQGALWFISRELHEAKKYKPTSRGGIAK